MSDATGGYSATVLLHREDYEGHWFECLLGDGQPAEDSYFLMIEISAKQANGTAPIVFEGRTVDDSELMLKYNELRKQYIELLRDAKLATQVGSEMAAKLNAHLSGFCNSHHALATHPFKLTTNTGFDVFTGRACSINGLGVNHNWSDMPLFDGLLLVESFNSVHSASLTPATATENALPRLVAGDANG